MSALGRQCAVCSTEATQRCSVCETVWYCGKEHQTEAWPRHKHYCHEPYQMGLYAAGQSETVTPVFIPRSTGSVHTLPRAKLSRLLSSPTENLEVMISPMSTLFNASHRIVCVYDAGPRGLVRPSGSESSILFSTAPGELCSHAVHMTRSLMHSFEVQINGGALFFYLQCGKDFLAQPDFSAAQAVIEAWNQADADCSQETFKVLAKVFAKNVSHTAANSRRRLDYLDAIVFPALEGKPLITKHPFLYTSPEPEGSDPRFFEPPFHIIEPFYMLGGPDRERQAVRWTPSQGPLENQLTIYMRDNFLSDGSPLNKSIRVATKGEAKHRWAGNIIVMKQVGSEDVGIDAGPDDVKAVVEYLCWYGS